MGRVGEGLYPARDLVGDTIRVPWRIARGGRMSGRNVTGQRSRNSSKGCYGATHLSRASLVVLRGGRLKGGKHWTGHHQRLLPGGAFDIWNPVLFVSPTPTRPIHNVVETAGQRAPEMRRQVTNSLIIRRTFARTVIGLISVRTRRAAGDPARRRKRAY